MHQSVSQDAQFCNQNVHVYSATNWCIVSYMLYALKDCEMILISTSEPFLVQKHEPIS